jgi:Motility related/secretion protein
MVRPLALCSIISLACCHLAFSQDGLHYETPVVGSFHSQFEDPASPSILFVEHPVFLTCKTTLFEDRQIIDFEKREISFERADKALNVVMWQYRFDELDSYLESIRRFALLNAWHTSQLSFLSLAQEKKKGINLLQWELPVQYPSWAQRILGKDPPKLSISGYEKIIVSYEYNKTEIPGSNLQNIPTQGLNFDQENQFSITGSVGRLININIKGSTKQGVDAGSDPLKNFKIEYKGEGDELEDEVVQEVVAGYTGFDMPGTQLSGYSESHQGLFGIKMSGKMGPLTLTGIASQEQGESQTMSFSPTGAGDANTKISEKDFLKYKMFFLDTMYLKHYLGKRSAVPAVKQLQVWISSQTIMNEATTAKSDKTQQYAFVGTTRQAYKRLVEKRDYFLSPQDGWIRFDSIAVQDADVIGLYLVFSDSTHSKGHNYEDTILVSNKGDFVPSTDTLWTLKFGAQDSTFPTFPLMWRNVCALPSGFDPNKFKLKVTLVTDTTVDKTSGRFFSAILGLTDENGVPKMTATGLPPTGIYDVDHSLIVLPQFTPADTTVRGNEPFSNPVLGSANTNGVIYRQVSPDWDKIVPKFQILMSGSSRKTQFTLGFGSVMENTEQLKVNGTPLIKNTDYLIDYQTGQVDLISQKAINATKIDAEFQSEALFVPKQKVFLGLHGEMKLPFGDKSILGASILYQDASTNEAVPKLNQEPFSKLLLDVNAKIDYEPEWMTKAVNLLPLVSTDAKSSVSIEFEVAHSYTNPNTSTGKDAYIDDFESSKQVYPLGLTQTTWYQASPPPDANGNVLNLLQNPPAWIQYWYAPLGNTEPLKSDIFAKLPVLQTQTDADKYEPALDFVCQPGPPLNNPYAGRYDNPWAGIMTWFPTGVQNRENDKYLEFWAKNTGGGRLYFDLGLVSEAISLDGGPPDPNPHLEDKNNSGVLADSIDIGLDGRVDTAEYYLVPNRDRTGWESLWYWLTNSDATKGKWYIDPKTGSRVIDTLLPIPRDPSKDNFQTYGIVDNSQKGNYKFVNGTEKNGYLNTEDINGDGFRTDEEYFRRFIDFDSAADSTRRNSFMGRNAKNYMVNDADANANPANGWHLYRIPLNDTTMGILNKKGNPQWTQIKFLRIWWSNFKRDSISRQNSVQFARMQFVGNQWLESQDSTRNSKLTVSTLNTVENPPPTYVPPPTLTILRDANGNLEQETSLNLMYNNINPGDVAIVNKTMPSQAINLSAYDNVSIMVHGDTARTDFWFFLRFGTNDSTYYECRTKMNKNGDWKEMAVRLQEISKLKLDYENLHGGIADSIHTLTTLANGDIVTIALPKGQSLSFAAVTWMAIGVSRDSIAGGTPYSGQIWVDELKVKGIQPLSGYAGRAYLSTHWADFMNFTTGLDYEDGSFQRMTETGTTLKNSTVSGNLSLDWKLDKFLPSAWGVNIPLGTRLQEQVSRPQIVPSSDIYLTGANGSPDGLGQMYGELINMIFGKNWNLGQNTPASHYQTTSYSQNWWTGFEDKTMSSNPLVNLTLNRISLADLTYGLNESQSGRGQHSSGNNDTTILDVDTLRSYHGTLRYDLSPKLTQKWVKWKPFEGTKILWLPERVKGWEFNWLPTTWTVDVAEVNYSNETTIKGLTGDTTRVKKLSLDHRTNLLYDPINILNLGYNLAISRNLDSVAGAGDLKNGKWEFLKNDVTHFDPTWRRYGVLYGERSRTQGATMRFDPSFLEWISHSADYSANYNQTATTMGSDPTSFMNLKSDETFHLASTLNLAALFKNFSTGLSGVKAISQTFASIQKAMEKLAFNSITFDYSAKSSVSNYNIDTALLSSRGIGEAKFLEYQLGLSGKTGKNLKNIVTGNMDDDAFGGMRFRPTLSDTNSQDQRSGTRSYGLSTSFNLPQPIDISFSSISLKWSNGYNVYADTTKLDSTRVFPDFSVNARSGLLNKISLVNRNVQSVQMTSGFNYLLSRHISGTTSDFDDLKSTTFGFNPVIGLDGTLKKWPVSINYAWTYSDKTDSSSRSKNITQTTSQDHKVGVRYEINKASAGKDEFKFLFWTIPIKGRIETGLEGDLGTNVAQSKPTDNSTGYVKTTDATTISLTPHASYDFTDNITGEAKYMYSDKKDISQTVTSHIFSLSVMIRF